MGMGCGGRSIYSTEEQREEEGRKNQAEMVEMTSNIEALKGAVVVLKKHQLTAFPQMKLNFLSVRASKHALNPEDDLDRLSAWMTQHRCGARGPNVGSPGAVEVGPLANF